jgi:hypothetical protein
MARINVAVAVAAAAAAAAVVVVVVVVVVVEDSFTGALIVAVRSPMAGLLRGLQVASTD